MATVNPVIRRGSTQDRNRQEEQDGNPQTNDDKVTRQGLAGDLNQRPTGIELHQADTPNSHKGLITSQENDQQRPEPIT